MYIPAQGNKCQGPPAATVEQATEDSRVPAGYIKRALTLQLTTSMMARQSAKPESAVNQL